LRENSMGTQIMRIGPRASGRRSKRAICVLGAKDQPRMA
jgi:hypothetical protein